MYLDRIHICVDTFATTFSNEFNSLRFQIFAAKILSAFFSIRHYREAVQVTSFSPIQPKEGNYLRKVVTWIHRYAFKSCCKRMAYIHEVLDPQGDSQTVPLLEQWTWSIFCWFGLKKRKRKSNLAYDDVLRKIIINKGICLCMFQILWWSTEYMNKYFWTESKSVNILMTEISFYDFGAFCQQIHCVKILISLSLV